MWLTASFPLKISALPKQKGNSSTPTIDFQSFCCEFRRGKCTDGKGQTRLDKARSRFSILNSRWILLLSRFPILDFWFSSLDSRFVVLESILSILASGFSIAILIFSRHHWPWHRCGSLWYFRVKSERLGGLVLPPQTYLQHAASCNTFVSEAIAWYCHHRHARCPKL